jgi:two-component sensor histidine kinase
MQDGNKVYEQSKQLAHLGDEVFDVAFDTYRKKILVAVRTQNFPCQFNDSGYNALPVVNSIEVRGNIMRLHQCANGTILFATDRGLVYSVDKRNICKLQLNEFNTKGIIRKFCNDPSGDTWIIYADKGLRRYSWHKDSLIFKEQLTKADGLSTNNITDLCFDNKNNLWASTNSNVTIFSKGDSTSDKKASHIVGFFNAEDLQTEGSIDARLTKDSKGNIWYFSNRHLVCFYPSKIIYNSTVPSIQIENVELNLRQTKWTDYTDSVSGIFQLPYNPKLSHNNNTLGFYFKGISSSGTEGIKYSYRLEGLEDLWSKPTSNYFVSFVKLPPGKYIFKVKAQLPNTEWSDPASFSFEIKKAFWQTWWYFLLWAMAISAGIYILFRYRLMQKIKLLEMRNRISQDLHDEIGASLSGINLLSQVAAEKLQNNNPAEASEFLGKVKNYSQDVIEKLSDMVWLFNPQNDSIEKILQRLKYFAMSIASSKDATMHFSTGKGTEVIDLSIRQRKAIYLVSKEAINNAVKYAECANIYFHLTPRGQGWKLQIRDDGKGFLPTANKNGNGLKNMYARAEEIGARFKIQTSQGAGTTIVMEL